MVLDLLVEEAHAEIELGRGKSGVAFKIIGPDGKPFVRKVFIGHPFANIVNTFTIGAPNPYAWNEDAVQTAFYRRRVEDKICDYFSSGRLRVAEPFAISWNEKYKAFQMDMEFIAGRKAGLRNPFTAKSELDELAKELVLPQREYLEAAGFDLWQKGHGNPTWPGNYLITSQPGEQVRAVQVDDESGGATFPVQAAINPLKFPYYAARTLKFRRPSFDDTDIAQLRKFVHEGGLERKLGGREYDQLLDDIDQLDHYQTRWKSTSRLESGIRFALSKDKLTREQAEFYRANPTLWYGLQAAYLAFKTGKKVAKMPYAAAKALARINYIGLGSRITKNTLLYLRSVEYRTDLARRYIDDRISSSERRGRLTEEQANILRQNVQSEKVAAYLPDFGFHIGIFISSKITLLAPPLYFLHMINESAGLLMVSGGSLARFSYTLARSIESLFRRKEIPYVAIPLSLVQGLGNMAYPAHIAATGTREDRQLSEYVIVDAVETVARKIPFWGGENTTLEAHANSIAYSGIRAAYAACHKATHASDKIGLPRLARFTKHKVESAKKFASTAI